MRTTITIGTQDVPMANSAFTAILYRQLFKKDFLQEMAQLTSLKDKKYADYTEAEKALSLTITDSYSRIAFVMARQGQTNSIDELMKVSITDYYEWMNQFPPNAFQKPDTMAGIIAFWNGNARNDIESKNTLSQETE